MKQALVKDQFNHHTGTHLKIARSKTEMHNSEPHFLEHPLFTDKASRDMATGNIPDLTMLYRLLADLLAADDPITSAISFLPALRAFSLSDREQIQRLINNPETNHVIAQNAQVKIMLIRWEPGAECKVHGHAEGGCVLKVLRGKVVEKRFTADSEQRLLSENHYETDSIAYIDDFMGLHSVANPNDIPAITLHLYTPGNYKAKQYVKRSS
jgi:hypothetical protein